MYGDGGGGGSFLPLWSTDTRSRDALYALPCKRFIAGIALYTVAQVMGRHAAVPHEDSGRQSARRLAATKLCPRDASKHLELSSTFTPTK